jgi:hypothetical protein
VCIENGDAGTGTWTEYSSCEGETVGGCIPGTTQTAACGNCGTQVNTCSKYCAWSNGTCAGQPANSCVPLSIDLSPAGCATGNTYRQRDCKTDCTWNNFSATCATPPTIIQVPPTVGQSSSTLVTLAATKMMNRLTSSCPNATVGTLSTAYEYIEVHNPNAKAALVTVYNSVAPGGPTIHTQLAAYAGSTPPPAASRGSCLKGVNTFGDDTISGDSSFSTLANGQRPTIPAGGSIIIYDAGFSATALGTVKLTVQLDALN